MVFDSTPRQRVALITGGNSGLGFSIAAALVRQGIHTFITCRSPSKGNRAIAALQATTIHPQVEALPLDLASLDSVRACAQQFRDRQLTLDILVNNAGIFRGHGTTAEGFETIWGINYLGHFLLTQLLRDRLAPAGRILVVASDVAHRPQEFDWAAFTQPTPWNFVRLYGLSKLCGLLFVREFDRRWCQPKTTANTGLTINALHPGFVRSNISFGHQLARCCRIGTAPDAVTHRAIALLTEPEWCHTSGTFVDRHLQPLTWPTLADDTTRAAQLWERSQCWTGLAPSSSGLSSSGLEGVSGASGERHPAFAVPKPPHHPESELFGTYRLRLRRETMQAIVQQIYQDVLPHPPARQTALQLLRFLLRLKFGSFFLLCVQLWKGEFYMERHLDAPAVQQLCRDPELLQRLREHLGDALTLWRSEIWVNYPARQLIPFWHRDHYPKLLSGTGNSINAYIALSDVTADNGFEYIPSAALSATNHTVQMSDPFSGNNLLDIDPTIAQQSVAIVLQAGEFVLFTDRLVHRSIRNTSGRTRLSIVLRVSQTSIEASGYTTACRSSSVTLPLD